MATDNVPVRKVKGHLLFLPDVSFIDAARTLLLSEDVRDARRTCTGVNECQLIL